MSNWARPIEYRAARLPGIGEAYSNTGYLLQAAIVEQLAGQDFDSYRRDRLFEPLGLSRMMADDGRRPGDGLAAASLVLPEMLEASGVGGLRWTDAKGRVRELSPV